MRRAVWVGILLTGSVLVAPVAASSPPAAPPALPVFGPFDGPSAAGERFLLERLGVAASSPQQLGAASDDDATDTSQPGQVADGGNVQTNDATTDSNNSTTQSETSVALRGSTVCAGFNDSGGANFSGLARSADRGATWTDLGDLPGGSGDPVITLHDATGTFYYASIATVGGDPAIGVAASTDDCQSFGAFVDASPVASQIVTTSLNDKPWIAVDNTGGANDGNLYVCWTRFDTATPSELRVSRSTDGGATFTDEQLLVSGTSPFGCSIQVTSDGTVHLAWADRAGLTTDDIRYARSTDQGQTYSVPTSLSTGNRHPGGDNVIACGNSNNRPVVNGNIRQLHQAWLAVDTTGGPHDGNLYAVWASDPAGGTDQADALFSRSTDGGTTWSTPVDLSPGAGTTDQWAPMVAVGGDGDLATMWYDRRDDAANNLNIHLYTAISSDGGATFEPIEAVTTQSFGVPQLLPNFDSGVRDCYMGEYNAVTGDESGFGYLWGDNRNTVTNTQWPSGRPDPDVFFTTRHIGDPPDLQTTVDDDADPVAAGESLTYTVTVTNAGAGAAPDASFEQSLPAGTTYASDDGGCDTTSLPALTCPLGELGPSASRVVHVTVSVDPSLVHDNGGPVVLSTTATAASSAADATPADNSDTEQTTVVARADLAIDALAVSAPESAIVGEDVPVTATATGSNAGPSSPIDAVVGTTGSAAPGGSITPAAQAADLAALAVGSPRDAGFDYTVRCEEGGEQEFTISASIAPAPGAGSDPTSANDTRSHTFTVTCIIPIAINNRPGDDPNVANLPSTVVAAALTTAAGEYGLPLAFDARTIDVASVRWGDRTLVASGTGGAPDRRGKASYEDSFEQDDVTRDGDVDAVMRFRAEEAGLSPTATEACMAGQAVLPGGETVRFFGCDTIRS